LAEFELHLNGVASQLKHIPSGINNLTSEKIQHFHIDEEEKMLFIECAIEENKAKYSLTKMAISKNEANSPSVSHLEI